MEFTLFLFELLKSNIKECLVLFKNNLLYFAALALVALVYVGAALDPQNEMMLLFALVGKMTVVASLIWIIVKKYDWSLTAFLRMGFISFVILAIVWPVSVSLWF